MKVAGCLVLAAVAACSRTDRPGPEPGRLVAAGAGGRLRFALELVPEPPRLGGYFSVRTRVEHAGSGTPVESGSLTLNATMPEHGHGMTTLPRTRHDGQRFRTEGCRFHMYGRWVFTLACDADGITDHARIEYRFEPPAALGVGGK